MKQTAVNWLVQEANLLENNYWISPLVEQAKEMEKDQIIDFVDNLIIGMSREKIEQYYNETFKSE